MGPRMEQAGCSSPKQQTDTDVIFGLIEQARDKAEEIRERSAGIKSISVAGNICGKSENGPIDVSERIKGGIQSIINSLDDSLSSLRAFN